MRVRMLNVYLTAKSVSISTQCFCIHMYIEMERYFFFALKLFSKCVRHITTIFFYYFQINEVPLLAHKDALRFAALFPLGIFPTTFQGEPSQGSAQAFVIIQLTISAMWSLRDAYFGIKIALPYIFANTLQNSS